jgi:hypothetical protein
MPKPLVARETPYSGLNNAPNHILESGLMTMSLQQLPNIFEIRVKVVSVL